MKTIQRVRMMLLLLMVFAVIAPQVDAASGTWTATGAGAIEYWTNNANWSGASYPGSDGTGQSAYLTNGTANTYTSILDTTIPKAVSTLAISNNGGGQAWLIVTNATLTNTTFSLNTGGRLRIDNGGSVTGITTFGWAGTDGALLINSGGQLFGGGTITLGNGVTGTVSTLGSSGQGGAWNVNGTINVGTSAGTGSVMTVNGVTLSNLTAYVVGKYGKLTLTNGAGFRNTGDSIIGNSGASIGNTVEIKGTNTSVSIARVYVSQSVGVSNSFLVSDGAAVRIFNNGGGSSQFSIYGINNAATITGSGSLVSNTVGGTILSGTNNSLLVTAGGKMFDPGPFVGNSAGAMSNTITITGPGSRWDWPSGLAAGYAGWGTAAGACFNGMTLSNGAMFTHISASGGVNWDIGSGAGANSNFWQIGGLGAYSIATNNGLFRIGVSGAAYNYVNITNGYLSVNGSSLQIGVSTTNNSINIYANGTLDTQGNALTVGSGAAAQNQVRVFQGGILEANSMIASTGTDNVITNSGGVYQFTTATPTITTNGTAGGSIFINSGVIAFRSIGANLTNNTDATRLGRLTWIGDNAFRLNNSISTNSVAGGYTFQTGNPVNYARLEMINGTNRLIGQNINLGSGGSLMVRDTTAIVSGAVTNNLGTMEIISGTLTCSNGLTLNSGGTTVVGLQQTTSGRVKVTGSFTSGGTLTVTNVTGFILAGGLSWDLFDWTGGTIGFAATNLPSLGSGLSWDTSQLGANGTLAIISGGAVTNVWAGGTSTDWNTDGNWAEGHVPTPTEVARIANNSPTYWPLLDMNRTVPTLLLETGAQLSLGGKNLTISSNLVMTGTMIASGTETVTLQGDAAMNGGTLTAASSTLVIGGTGAQTVNFSNITFSALVSSNASAVTIGGPFRAGNVTHTGGNAAFNGGFSATNFNCNAPGATLTFQNGKTVAVTNLTLYGGAANRMTLVSSTSPAKWNIRVTGASYVSGVTVSDSDASGGLTIRPVASSEGTGGSTVNWDFGSGAWQVWKGGNAAFMASTNWVPNGVPDATSRLYIETTSGMGAPLLSNTLTVAELAIGGVSSAVLTVQSPLTVTGRVAILPNGVLTHQTNGLIAQYSLDLTVSNNLEIAPAGAIDLTGKGYMSYGGPAPGTYGGNPWYGAGHGGTGGHDEGHGPSPYPTYGSVTNPVTLGSGGATSGGNETPGGGAAILRVGGQTYISEGGRICANVPDAPGFWRGGGAGGSVNLTTATLAGSGVIQAHGGKGSVVGGGGGRVAVKLTSGNSFGGVAISAYGGMDGYITGTRYGGAGTVYLQTASQGEGNGDLVVDNYGYSTPADVTTLISSNATDATAGDVLIRNSARFALGTNCAITVGGSWSNAATFTAATGGVVCLRGPNAGTIYGTNVFQILAITNVANKTVYFQAGKTNWVNGALLLRNATLRSTTDNTQWHIRLANDAAQSVDNVFVRDSNATNGQTIVAWPCSRDQGNNVNWFFHTDPGSVFRMK